MTPRVHVVGGRLALCGLLLVMSCPGRAQTEDADSVPDADSEAEAVEEIVVIGARPGDPRRLDRIYEDPLRARIQRELRELEVLEEEYQWRREGARVEQDPPRIRWGYDPRDELRTRRDNELFDLPTERVTRPATIFSVEF